jgi:hypothetical protein
MGYPMKQRIMLNEITVPRYRVTVGSDWKIVNATSPDLVVVNTTTNNPYTPSLRHEFKL